MTGREEVELPQSLLFFFRVCESSVLRMKILVAFYGLLLTSYLRTIFGRPTLNSTSEIDMMATLQRSKREFQERDYDDYYNDLELEILESRKELLEKTFLPPDLPLSSSVKNNIQLLKETTKNAPEYMMDLYKSYSEKKSVPAVFRHCQEFHEHKYSRCDNYPGFQCWFYNQTSYNGV